MLGLAPHYQNLLVDPEAVRPQAPWQSPSDCHSCALSNQNGYSQRRRCCTYYPFVANFQLGQIPATSPAATTIKHLIDQNLTTPAGLLATPGRLAAYATEINGAAFRAEAGLRCDFASDSGCTIYQHRSPTCATWYCRPHYFTPWLQALEAWLSHCWAHLWYLCLAETAIAPQTVLSTLKAYHQAPPTADAGYSETLLQQLWRDHRPSTKQAAIFAACGATFQRLTTARAERQHLHQILLSAQKAPHIHHEETSQTLTTIKTRHAKVRHYQSGQDLWQALVAATAQAELGYLEAAVGNQEPTYRNQEL